MRVVGDTASVEEKLIKRKHRWISPPPELPFSVIVLCLANLNCAFFYIMSCSRDVVPLKFIPG